jgi:hypothetical protein
MLVLDGIVKLTPEEVSHMEDSTTLYKDPNGDYHVGGVEMWHQLHCLVIILKLSLLAHND